MNGILEQLCVGFNKYNIYSLCICPVPISLSVVLITFDILFSLFFFFLGGRGLLKNRFLVLKKSYR